eukprot:3716556-Rhodomonas_salina.1
MAQTRMRGCTHVFVRLPVCCGECVRVRVHTSSVCACALTKGCGGVRYEAEEARGETLGAAAQVGLEAVTEGEDQVELDALRPAPARVTHARLGLPHFIRHSLVVSDTTRGLVKGLGFRV